MTDEDLKYQFDERIAIGMIEGGLDELKATQQARIELINQLKQQMPLSEAVYKVYKINC